MADKYKIYASEVSAQNKAALLTICTAQEVQNRMRNLLKVHDISFTQLTILHILDELPSNEITVNTIRQLMIDDSPNVSRSLNKLASKDLINKERSTKDQRVVYISITEAGKKLHLDCDHLLFAENLLDLPDKESAALVETLMKV